MGSLGIGHWLIVLVVVLLLFGTGKIPKIMGDIACGLKSFRREISENKGGAMKCQD